MQRATQPKRGRQTRRRQARTRARGSLHRLVRRRGRITERLDHLVLARKYDYDDNNRYDDYDDPNYLLRLFLPRDRFGGIHVFFHGLQKRGHLVRLLVGRLRRNSGGCSRCTALNRYEFVELDKESLPTRWTIIAQLRTIKRKLVTAIRTRAGIRLCNFRLDAVCCLEGGAPHQNETPDRHWKANDAAYEREAESNAKDDHKQAEAAHPASEHRAACWKPGDFFGCDCRHSVRWAGRGGRWNGPQHRPGFRRRVVGNDDWLFAGWTLCCHAAVLGIGGNVLIAMRTGKCETHRACARASPNENLDCNLQSISASIEAA